MLVLLVNPQSWMNFSKKIYSNSSAIRFVAFILGTVVLYYLVQSGMTIVQILAVTAFVALLISFGLAKEGSALIKKFEPIIKKGNLWKEYWLYTLIWVVLLIWGVKELFF